MDAIKEKLNNFLFSKRNKRKSYYVCPKCGSNDWKFPNPIKPAESMINTYQLVNSLFECKDCGHIGIFFKVNDLKSINFVKRNETKKFLLKPDYQKKDGLFSI